jgi:hypothetical protein
MFKQSLLALGFIGFSALAAAQAAEEYRVTITNITPGQTFTPQLVVTHARNYAMFNLGSPASDALEIMAEGGDTGPLMEEVADRATDMLTIDGLLGPGETTSTVVTGIPGQDFISIAAMLIPTNDNFIALNRLRLPESGAALLLVPGYDAGTEENDQSCASIPGPRCGGEGYSPEPGEGFVHIGNGFHDLGESDENGAEVLKPKVYDWRNWVARIVVRRLPQ